MFELDTSLLTNRCMRIRISSVKLLSYHIVGHPYFKYIMQWVLIYSMASDSQGRLLYELDSGTNTQNGRNYVLHPICVLSYGILQVVTKQNNFMVYELVCTPIHTLHIILYSCK